MKTAQMAILKLHSGQYLAAQWHMYADRLVENEAGMWRQIGFVRRLAWLINYIDDVYAA